MENRNTHDLKKYTSNYNLKQMKNKNRLLYKPPPLEDYSRNFCKLYIVIAISFVFIAAEFVGGFISGSISVISDAFHLVTDLIGFGISFLFISISRRDPTEKMSFGFHRMELLGALGNLFIIWFLAIFMIYEATVRVINKEFVAEPLAMLIVGVGGLGVNIVMYFVLHSGSHSHGLMSDSCDHHHEPHDNDPNPSNCTTSFCNELVCEDEVCLKQVNFSHCHVKNPEGEEKIHIHEGDRKLSDELDGRPDQNTMNHLDNSENKMRNQKQHDHVNVGAFGQQHEHQHNHKNEHKHVHGQNCKHDHKPSNIQQQVELRDISLKIANKQAAHVHGQNCSHNHVNSQKPKPKEPKEQHKHGEGCKHGHEHDHKQKNHSHNHEQGHEHHDHQHQHIHHEQHESISMKAAVLHAFSDVIQSIGLLISSLFIFFLGSDKGAQVHEWNDWHYFDPISTYIFSVIVICSTIPIVKNCYYIIMESTPSTEIARLIKREFEQSPGVVDVHDLHIWSLRPGKNLLIAHVFAKDGAEREVLTNLTQICRRRKIYHSTLQVEEENWKDHEQYILCAHDIH